MGKEEFVNHLTSDIPPRPVGMDKIVVTNIEA